MEESRGADAEFFHFRISTLVEDIRRQFREVQDLDQAKQQREELAARVRFLKTRLVNAEITDRQKTSIDGALDELIGFFKNDVDPILAALEAQRPKPEPVEG